MVLKGCTATYDLYSEAPMVSVEGIEAVAAGYEDVGVRSTIAPMMADITLYKAIPELLKKHFHLNIGLYFLRYRQLLRKRF